MAQDIKITILMATYNRALLIGAGIDSVLNQKFKDFELLILDDASTDNTETIVSEYVNKDDRIKYIKNQQNLGVSKNRNHGLSLAKGKYIAILDSDDVWIDTEKLQKQYVLLENNPDIGLVGTFMIRKFPTKEDKASYEITDENIRKKILLRNQFAHSSVMYRKDLVNSGYNENLNLAEDYDLFLRIGIVSKFANIPDYSTKYLMNPSGESSKNKLKMALTVDRLIIKYKTKYPNYLMARIKSFLRIALSL